MLNGERKLEALPQISAQILYPSANIGIIGYGFVGEALGIGFNHVTNWRDRIFWYDKYKEGSEPLPQVVEKSDFIFIALPTPMKRDGSGYDLSIIEENISQITPLTDDTDKIIVIKSTVEPGTTENFENRYPKSNFCFNPEFLTEANYLNDFINASDTIIGATNDLVYRRVAGLYRPRFPRTHIHPNYGPTAAETVKQVKNAFLSTKVAFFNIVYDYCEALGLSFESVRNMVVSDERIGHSHSEVTPQRGFGGKCFPKDLVALTASFSREGVNTNILDAVWGYNLRIRKVRDWEEIPFAVEGNHTTQ